MARVDLYDNLAGAYDMLISWRRRLRREKPFFNRVFKKHRVRRVLDTACGTGMHAIAFHDWGYHVVGADISLPMVEKSRENAAGRNIEFVQAGFTELDKIGGMFDAVTCLGNSLPHVLTDEELDISLARMYRVLVPGGILVLHQNNYDRVLRRKERFMPIAQGKKNGKEYLFIRFFDFHGETLTFNVVTLARDGEWRMFPDSSTHRALTLGLLVTRLAKVGFTNMSIYGGYPDEPFEELESDNLIVVAEKPHNDISRPHPEPVKALDRVPIHDNGEPLVDLAVAAPEVSLRDEHAPARKTVVEMLKKAQTLLPDGHRLHVRIAYRTLSCQKELYSRFCKELSERHPDWPLSQVRREMNRFLAPPHAKHPPGHTTGGAVDVTIIGPDGEELDMASSLLPGTSQWLLFPIYSKYITPRAAWNRRILLDAMTGAGFSSYSSEWWHFSYGDSGWAVRTGAPHALYGAAPEP